MNQQELFSCIKTEAAAIDQVMENDLAAISCPHLPEVLRHGIFNGGKRIRPLLALMAGRLAPHPPADETALYQLAITFEYLHAASLLHDDVIDHADTRRGQPTANVVWDNQLAILAGDFLHARAMTLAGTVGGAACLTIIGQATADMVEAEFLQLDTAAQSGRASEAYFSVIAGKTAALIAAACETGILLAGGNKEECASLRLYGTNLGLAFQIVDDLLDYQGDPARTGKAVGNDFIEGKMTLPLLLALGAAEENDCAPIIALLAGTADDRHPAVDQARTFIARHDGFNRARHKAEALITEAVLSLDRFPVSLPQSILTGLAFYVLNRDK